MSRSTTYSALRANLKHELDAVCSNHEPLRVERKSGEAVVVLSASDFAALEETAYLLRSPANVRRIMRALHGSRRGDKAFAHVRELSAKLGFGS